MNPDEKGKYSPINREQSESLKLGDIAGTIRDCDKAIRLKLRDPLVYLLRARASERQGKFGRAIKDYSKAIALNPNESEAYFGRGLANTHLENLHEAMADCDSAISIDSSMPLPYLLRGALHRRFGNVKAAIADHVRFQEIVRDSDEDRFRDRRETIEAWIGEFWNQSQVR